VAVCDCDRSFVPHPRLRRRRRHRSLLEDGHSTLRCGRPCCEPVTHGVQELYRCIRVAVIAIDAVFDARVVHKTPLMVQAFDHSCIVHSRIVHPCHIVLICPLLQSPSLQYGAELSTPALSTPANSAFPCHFNYHYPHQCPSLAFYIPVIWSITVTFYNFSQPVCILLMHLERSSFIWFY